MAFPVISFPPLELLLASSASSPYSNPRILSRSLLPLASLHQYYRSYLRPPLYNISSFGLRILFAFLFRCMTADRRERGDALLAALRKPSRVFPLHRPPFARDLTDQIDVTSRSIF